ncbi:hypothetical protein A2999_01850 [Candidatus Wolfebacteria bacterium RIFCSPLOWO2_01_FULL_38_11]|uniref:Uncharacterized protein n=2 Tax=Candidatus Wolfeibacteriota TaxID=1752735 RepID=A0A1F8DS83_9BACT|nr:MAG: hypothetical protein A2999_01850 [Candidatus Wolfebacteria bacterium RIFCSPLOWO2_01_FULL_38_11]
MTTIINYYMIIFRNLQIKGGFMRKVDLSYLPEGFSAEEEEDYLHLKYKGEEVAVFYSKRITKKIIKKVIEMYRKYSSLDSI